VLYQKVNDVQDEIIISSPYFINNANTWELMDDLLKRKVKMTIYTNSLASTDAIYVAANFYKSVFVWQALGVAPYVNSGKWIDEGETISKEVKNAKWGTHSKTQVYDDDEIMIGTYNIDNRSNFYNSEMALFCKGNYELVEEVRNSILGRAKEGYLISSVGTAVDKNGKKVSVYGASAGLKSKLAMLAIFLPSWLLKFLL